MRRLFAAFSFSFMIIAGFLAWHAYSSLAGRGPFMPRWRIILEFVIAGVLLVCSLIGARMRHRTNL